MDELGNERGGGSCNGGYEKVGDVYYQLWNRINGF